MSILSDVEQEIAEEMELEEGDPPRALEGTDDDQEGAEEGADAVAADPAPRSQKEIEELQGKLEREGERHAKRVAEIMGDDFALLVPNPTDWTPGYVFNVPPMHPSPDQVAALHAILGQLPPVELKEAEDAEVCEKCGGLGDVLTGSRKPGQETKPCSACTGTGWKTKIHLAQPLPQPSGAAAVYPGQPVSPDTYQVIDSWGRPAGHPHFGREPASITA